MQAAEKLEQRSWVSNSSPMTLGEIFSPQVSVAVWERESNSEVNQYFDNAFSSLGMGIRGVYSISSLKESLKEQLPDFPGKNATAEDLFLLADMLTCLFDCEDVGLRLVPLTKAMCPKLHVDNIPVRLVSTYLGDGTEWLPSEAIATSQPQCESKAINRSFADGYYSEDHILQMQTFDVGLLKGLAWEKHENFAAIHRSCQLKENQRRVLLSLDPM